MLATIVLILLLAVAAATPAIEGSRPSSIRALAIAVRSVVPDCGRRLALSLFTLFRRARSGFEAGFWLRYRPRRQEAEDVAGFAEIVRVRPH